MSDLLPAEWPRMAIEILTAMVSAVGGLVIGAWRWGRQTALRELRAKEDSVARIEATERGADVKLETLVSQFKETFAGLRRAIDDDRLHTEQNFVRKDDFKDFREEYREDMRELKNRMTEISKLK